MIHSWVLALACLTPLLAADPVSAATVADKDSTIQWHESYDKAFAEATDRGVPLLIVIIQDGEEANEDVWGNTLHTPVFAEASSHCVCLIANRGDEKTHGTKEIQRNGHAVKVCAKFGAINCQQHKATEIGVFRDFAHDGTLKTPLVIVALPDLTIVKALQDRHPIGEFVAAIEEGRKKLPDGLSYDEAIAVRAGLSDSRKWLEAGETQKVLEFVLPYSKRKSTGRLLEQTALLLADVEARGKAELDAVQEKVKARDYRGALADLEAIPARYKGSLVEVMARERHQTLSKNPDVKATILAQKREENARSLLERADALHAKGEDARADRLYDQLRKTLADTEAAKELAARGP